MGQATTERLSRERILDAAAELVSRDAPDALSMRRLAQELDVWPMGLYRYFHDKDELVAALAERAAAGVAVPSASAPWRDRLVDLLRQARALVERHPGALTDGHVREIGRDILRDAGVRDADAAWLALLAYTAGAATLGVSDDEFGYGLASLLAGIEQNGRP